MNETTEHEDRPSARDTVVGPHVWQRAWDVIAEVRDGAARTPDDADTGDIVDALVDAGLLR